MSHNDCQKTVLEIVDRFDDVGGRTKFQLQTNGIGDVGFYKELIERKDKIDRIGFTFHRTAFDNRIELDTMSKAFKKNVLLVKNAGIKVYVKELLFIEHKEHILKHKKTWESLGIEFRIQDFKGGINKEEKYTEMDLELIHPEYCHGGPSCHCREGYTQIIVRGYDIFGGDVLACWQDHKVIGNIVEDWYEPYDAVLLDAAMPRRRRVLDGRLYRSDYAHDVLISDLENKYHLTGLSLLFVRRDRG